MKELKPLSIKETREPCKCWKCTLMCKKCGHHLFAHSESGKCFYKVKGGGECKCVVKLISES